MEDNVILKYYPKTDYSAIRRYLNRRNPENIEYWISCVRIQPLTITARARLNAGFKVPVKDMPKDIEAVKRNK